MPSSTSRRRLPSVFPTTPTTPFGSAPLAGPGLRWRRRRRRGSYGGGGLCREVRQRRRGEIRVQWSELEGEAVGARGWAVSAGVSGIGVDGGRHRGDPSHPYPGAGRVGGAWPEVGGFISGAGPAGHLGLGAPLPGVPLTSPLTPSGVWPAPPRPALARDLFFFFFLRSSASRSVGRGAVQPQLGE